MPMRGREAMLTVAVGLAALAVQVPIFDRWLGLLDEGYFLAVTEDVLRGKVLYRDVYIDNPLPGAFYVLAAWFRVLGPSIWSSRVLAVGVFAVFAMLVFRLGRAVLPRGWAFLLVGLLLCYRLWAFPHWQTLSYSSLSATALAAALVVAFRYLRNGAPALLVATGAFVGAAILCKQDYGLGVGGALGLALLLRPVLSRSPRGAVLPASLYTAGIVFVLVPPLVAFAAAGALGALVEQTFLRPLLLESTFNYARLPPVFPLLAQTPGLRADAGSYFPAILITLTNYWNAINGGWLYRETAVWDVVLKLTFYAPFVAWIGAAFTWLRRRPADERRLFLLAYAGGFLLAFNRPRDWVHLMMLYPPTLLLGLTLLASLPPRVERVAAVMVGLGLVGLALVSLRLGVELRSQFAWRLATPRAGIAADFRGGPLLDDVLAYVARRAPADAPVPAYPLLPMLEFLAGREGAGGFHVIWPGQNPARDERIIADLEARDVSLMLYSLSQYRDNAPRLYDYLVDHFAIERVFTREPFGPLLCALGRRPVGDAEGRSLLELVPSAEPPGALVTARWPFTEVMAETVGRHDAPVIARLVLDVPPGTPRLVFQYGVNPERWLEAPSGPFTFTLAVEAGGHAAVAAFGATIDPHRRLEDRKWSHGSVDLTPWAGQRVRLALAIEADALPHDAQNLAGWAEPRLVDH